MFICFMSFGYQCSQPSGILIFQRMSELIIFVSRIIFGKNYIILITLNAQ